MSAGKRAVFGYQPAVPQVNSASREFEIILLSANSGHCITYKRNIIPILCGARQYQVSLAARRYRIGRDDVLRRRCRAAGLLPASLAASAGQSRVTLTPNQRQDLLRIEQGRDPAAIAAAITAVRRDNPDADLLEIEQMLRAAASSAFVIATDDGFRIVIGMQAWVAELNALGRSPEGNRALLAAR